FSSAGLLLVTGAVSRPRRTSWLIVGIQYPLVPAGPGLAPRQQGLRTRRRAPNPRGRRVTPPISGKPASIGCRVDLSKFAAWCRYPHGVLPVPGRGKRIESAAVSGDRNEPAHEACRRLLCG